MSGFWQGRRVFVTGHTGFKGAWLGLWLERLGARVSALALAPDTSPSLYELLSPWPGADHQIGDIRDGAGLAARLRQAAPEVVIHLAAQALVRRSYDDPVGTFATNVLGTVHLLEAVRQVPSVRTVLVITSDKVYANDGQGRAYEEPDPLGGADPYSSSKACTELVCRSYAKSFLRDRGVALATARAGNVIGGGDWAKDRLVPDFVRALDRGTPVPLRYPAAVRPWQHVLEPLAGYLAYARALTEGAPPHALADLLPDALNFGPAPQDFATVAGIAGELGRAFGLARAWEPAPGTWPAEAPVLTLTSARAGTALGWQPRLDRRQTIEWTAAWYKAYRDGADMRAFSLQQIAAYEEAAA